MQTGVNVNRQAPPTQTHAVTAGYSPTKDELERSIVFEGDTWGRDEDLRIQGKQLHRNLCRLIKEMQRGDPAVGTGKPEALRHGLTGLWSRRLSQKDRLIYRYDETAVYIFAIGGHDDDR